MRAICIYNYAWFSMIYLHFTPSSAKSGHVLWKPLTVLGFLCMFLHETASSTLLRHRLRSALSSFRSAGGTVRSCIRLPAQMQIPIPEAHTDLVWVVVSVSNMFFLSLTWGNYHKSSNVSNIFSDGLVQPPTSSLQIFLCCVKINKMWFELKKTRLQHSNLDGFGRTNSWCCFCPKKHVGGDLYQIHLIIDMSLWKKYIHVYVYIDIYIYYVYILCMLLHFELAPVIYKESQFLTKKHLQQLFPTTLPYALC